MIESYEDKVESGLLREEDMVILHIASIHNTKVSGMDMAVPQHIKAQSEFAQVGFVNVTGEEIPGIKNQFKYKEGFCVSALPDPYCKPDLIVFHEVYKPVYLKLYRQIKAEGIPYIIFPQGCLTTVAQSKKRLKKCVANLLLFNGFIRGAKALQFLSEWERDHSPFGTVKIIGTHGMHMPDEREKRLDSPTVRFVYIGRTEVYIKGLDLMLQAVHEVADQLRAHKARFALYGPDSERGHAEIHSLIKQFHIEDLVELSGAVTGEEKKEQLLCADVFIQTSRTDGFPLGVLEAMSYGIPCLVTEGTSYGSIVSNYNTGWVAETTAPSIAATILKALEEWENWPEKAENSRALVKERYTWSKAAEHVIQEYRNILN